MDIDSLVMTDVMAGCRFQPRRNCAVLYIRSLNTWRKRKLTPVMRQKFKQRNFCRLLDSRKFEIEFYVYV